MKFKDLRIITSKYEMVDIYCGTLNVYRSNILLNVPKYLDESKIRTISFSNNVLVIYLEG